MRVNTPMLLLRLHWLASTDTAPRLCCMQGVYDGSVQALSLALVGSSELVGRVFGERRARVGLGRGASTGYWRDGSGRWDSGERLAERDVGKEARAGLPLRSCFLTPFPTPQPRHLEPYDAWLVQPWSSPISSYTANPMARIIA